jgi:gluconate 2-dehydrogenase gamma chain
MADDLTRRQLLEVAAGAVVAVPLVAAASAASAAEVEAAVVVPSFLTAPELTLVDELTEMIIPTDEHSPGARAAKVAAYIDARLAEAFDKGVRTRWRAGLQAIDAAAKAAHGHAFMRCTPDERLAILTKIAEGEPNPQTPVERFFVELKQMTVKGYYSSEIGIHKEMEYKGNTLQEEYSGIDVSK